MPEADSKPLRVVYLPLETPEELLAAMQYAHSIGYYGIITMTEAGAWSITLTGPGQPRIDANLGQALVWNSTSLLVMSMQEFHDMYTPA